MQKHLLYHACVTESEDRKGLTDMKIKDGFILRQVAGNSIVIAVGDEAVNFNGLITVNGAGTFLWNLLAEGATEEELLTAMRGEYDVDEETAKADIAEFLDKLKKADLIEA